MLLGDMCMPTTPSLLCNEINLQCQITGILSVSVNNYIGCVILHSIYLKGVYETGNWVTSTACIDRCKRDVSLQTKFVHALHLTFAQLLISRLNSKTSANVFDFRITNMPQHTKATYVCVETNMI